MPDLKEIIDRHIEDKNQKVKIYTTWFNFYWSLNIIAVTVFQAESFEFAVALLFMLLTGGSIFSTIIIFSYNMRKSRLINALLREEQPLSPPLYLLRHEILWNLAYLLSFIILLGFWTYIIMAQV